MRFDQRLNIMQKLAKFNDGSFRSLLVAVFTALATASISTSTHAQETKPNIVIIMGDDIGYWNLSHNNDGMMGYRTPNIDRLAKEGLRFTDYYAQQSCTAGRAAFITGQMPIRTGLTKVGVPGADLGIRPEDPTLATVLKSQGYATGQFGKNHLGDRDEFLPTVHGFDEFFGNLYHLNAEETPELPNYPKDPEFRKKFGPRGVLRSKADGKGGQTVEDTGPLTKKRMEHVDTEFADAAIDFLKRKTAEKNPFFCWFNSSRMHYRTHVPKEWQGKSGLNYYADGMLQHDADVGRLLKTIDDLGITENTIVIYTTDNGPHYNMWPDGAITPFRGEKVTNWEGAYRVPCLVRWPGKIKPDTVINQVISSEDWFPTLAAAAGVRDVRSKLKSGMKLGETNYKVHLDGYNLLPWLTGEKIDPNVADGGMYKILDKQAGGAWPRHEFFYWNDEGQLVGMRYDRWKLVFMEQRSSQFGVWVDPFIPLRIPKLFDLRMDPFERASTDANHYWEWLEENIQWAGIPGQVIAGEMISSFKEFPPRQRPAKFNLDEVMEKFTAGADGK